MVVLHLVLVFFLDVALLLQSYTYWLPAEFQEELVIVKLVARIITTDTTAAVLDALSFILF
jgi:hypothetical protein